MSSSLPDNFLTARAPRKSQVKFVRPAQMALFARLITYPPLAQVTILPTTRRDITFTVIIESSTTFPNQPWETSIWYDHAGYSGSKSAWQALNLRQVNTTPIRLTGRPRSKVFRHVFTSSLPSPFSEVGKTYKGRNIKFTVRYRTGPTEAWQWVNTQFGTKDGELILQPPIDPNWVSASPVELDSGWSTRKLSSESPDARLYYIESTHPMPNPDPDNASFHSKILGRVTLCIRFFALTRVWSAWLGPRHGDGFFNITEDAIVCSFLRTDGRHVVILAVNGIDDTLTVFKSDPSGNIVVSARNDGGKDAKFRLLASSAWDFEVALAAAVYEMRRMIRLGSTSTAPSRRPSQPPEPARRLSNHSPQPQHIRADSLESDPEALLVSRGRELSLASSSEEPGPTPQWLENWYDNLAYCTWNSLGQDLSSEKVLTALDSLEQQNIRVASVIIDDNWQSIDTTGKNQFQRGMTGFEANSNFPGGLKALITQIREKYPWIRDVAVWHALLGYWGGIAPKGDISENYRTLQVERSPNDVASGKMTVIHPDDIQKWYDDFYRFLSNSGVTGVKTDAQFMLDMLADTRDRRAMMMPFQSAWIQAQLSHFSGKAISCMSQIPQILYHTFLPTDKPRILLRNSDDFFPDIQESHTWHVFCNAHNALFVQHLNALPDWDMFQTVHDYSGFHAASRCLSGGPIYITDAPGKHDVNLIKQMTARGVRSGESVILRPSNVAKCRSIYDKYDEGHVLRLAVWDGKSEVGTGMLGVFNIAKEEKSFILPMTEFPGVEVREEEENKYQTFVVNGADLHREATEERKWVFRSHGSGLITKPVAPRLPLTPEQFLQGRLSVRGYDIWSSLPVHPLELNKGKIEIAVLGLLGKMTGAVAIVESRFSVVDGGRRAKVAVQLKALGVLGIWVGETPAVADLMVLIHGKPVPEDKVRIENADAGVSSEENGTGGEEEQGDINEAGVIVVDVEGAWNEMRLDPGWSNEVWVDVFIP